MGLNYVAFACSAEQFASVYSSRDDRLFAKLLASEDQDVRHFLQLDDRDDAPPKTFFTGPRAALRDIFIGAALTQHRSHEYAYAHLACAYVLGTHLEGSSGGSWGRDNRLQELLDSLGEPGSLVVFEGEDWPLPTLPPFTEGLPMYQVVPAGEVALRAAALAGVVRRTAGALATDDYWDEREFLEELARYHAECATLGQDLLMVGF